MLVLDPPNANSGSTSEFLQHQSRLLRLLPVPPPEAAGWQQRDTAIDVEHDLGVAS